MDAVTRVAYCVHEDVQFSPASRVPRFSGVVGVSEDTVHAAQRACDECLEQLGGSPDFTLAFFSGHHVEASHDLARVLQSRMGAAPIIGVSAQGVIAGGMEFERAPAISLFAGRVPGVRVQAFTDDDLNVVENADEAKDQWRPLMGVANDTRACIICADPTSVPMMTLLPWFNAALDTSHADRPQSDERPVLLGGMASAGVKPGTNAIMLNDRVRRHGLVGLTLSGTLHVDTVISQGCKPFGPNLVVTRSHRNLIFELGGKPALPAMQEIVGALSDDERELLKGGFFLGLVIDENKPRFGRNDFLMRAVLGADTERNAVAVADFPKVGQTVRLHMRDAQTAREDLALLLDAQKLYDPPRGSLLITCNGRGENLFKKPHQDASAVQRAFAIPKGGESFGAGEILDPASDQPIPQAGFFAAGEVGPIGGRSFLHGNTACAVLFRDA